MTEEQFEVFKKDINENGIDDIQCIAVIKYGTTNLDIIKELFNNGETNIEDVLTINPEWALSFFQWIEPTPIYDPQYMHPPMYTPPIYRLRQLEKITGKKIGYD